MSSRACAVAFVVCAAAAFGVVRARGTDDDSNSDESAELEVVHGPSVVEKPVLGRRTVPTPQVRADGECSATPDTPSVADRELPDDVPSGDRDNLSQPDELLRLRYAEYCKLGLESEYREFTDPLPAVFPDPDDPSRQLVVRRDPRVLLESIGRRNAETPIGLEDGRFDVLCVSRNDRFDVFPGAGATRMRRAVGNMAQDVVREFGRSRPSPAVSDAVTEAQMQSVVEAVRAFQREVRLNDYAAWSAVRRAIERGSARRVRPDATSVILGMNGRLAIVERGSDPELDRLVGELAHSDVRIAEQIRAAIR